MDDHSLVLEGPDLASTLQNVRAYFHDPADLTIEWLDQDGPSGTALVFLQGLVNESQLRAGVRELLHQTTGVGVPEENRGLQTALADLQRGKAIVLRQEADRVLHLHTLAVPGWELRPIEEPLSERLIRGPREGFTETISVNTAMIRRWISDPGLRVDELRVGLRTATPVRLVYLEDVASTRLVAEAKRRIARIEIDGVLESGYLEQFIADDRWTPFPLIQSTERTDKVAAGILEGRVAILVDKSPFALLVPVTINELYQSPEDYYYNSYLGSFLRFFRLLGSNLAVALPGLYIALASFNPELLPTNLAFAVAESRRGVPYPIFVEVLLLEITVEIFREAGLRLPRSVSQTLGIVAGVALAYAAVQSHLVSGTSLVVVAIGAVASFTAPNFAVGIPWRILKLSLIVCAGMLGIVGLTLGGVLILAHAATLTSFGTSYLAPWAPIRPYELRDSIFRVPLGLRLRRSESYHARERKRLPEEDESGRDRP